MIAALTSEQAFAAISLIAAIDTVEAITAIESPMDVITWGRDLDAAHAAFEASLARYVAAGLVEEDWHEYRANVSALRAMCGAPRQPRRDDRCYIEIAVTKGWEAAEHAWDADHDAWIVAGYAFDMSIEAGRPEVTQ